MDSVSPFIEIGDVYVYKMKGYLVFFKCAQIDQIIFSVSGSNHSVTFIQIIIFQVHNNYQKEVTGFKLSHEAFDLTLYIKMPGCHTTWYNKVFFETFIPSGKG